MEVFPVSVLIQQHALRKKCRGATQRAHRVEEPSVHLVEEADQALWFDQGVQSEMQKPFKRFFAFK